MTRLQWEKQNSRDKASKEEVPVPLIPKKSSRIDYYLRLKALITKIENKSWLDKKKSKRSKFKTHLITNLQSTHQKLLRSHDDYKDGKLYKKVKSILDSNL
jgi:hypothetical protein